MVKINEVSTREFSDRYLYYLYLVSQDLIIDEDGAVIDND